MFLCSNNREWDFLRLTFLYLSHLNWPIEQGVWVYVRVVEPWNLPIGLTVAEVTLPDSFFYILQLNILGPAYLWEVLAAVLLFFFFWSLSVVRCPGCSLRMLLYTYLRLISSWPTSSAQMVPAWTVGPSESSLGMMRMFVTLCWQTRISSVQEGKCWVFPNVL